MNLSQREEKGGRGEGEGQRKKGEKKKKAYIKRGRRRGGGGERRRQRERKRRKAGLRRVRVRSLKDQLVIGNIKGSEDVSFKGTYVRYVLHSTDLLLSFK